MGAYRKIDMARRGPTRVRTPIVTMTGSDAPVPKALRPKMAKASTVPTMTTPATPLGSRTNGISPAHRSPTNGTATAAVSSVAGKPRRVSLRMTVASFPRLRDRRFTGPVS